MNREPGKTVGRSGLTLVELIVVLTILIAVSALLVPLLPSMVSRSHDASSATNISDISRQVQTYNQLYFGYPNNLDNLVEAGTGGGNALLGTLAGGANLNNMVTAQKLTQAQATALSNIGITSFANLTGTAPATIANWSPTFFPYTTMAPNQSANVTLVSSLPTVAVLTGTTTTVGATPAAGTGLSVGVAKLGLSPTGTYVVLGFGSANSAVGKVVQECPVHFPDQQTINPAITYQRYGLIFLVSENNPAVVVNNAQLVGVVCLLDDGIETAGDHIQDYFSRSQQGG
jgi:type II secretory pathway pseudopilin PulG